MSGGVETFGWLWPYVVILIAGWFPTDIWRFLGVILAGKLQEDSEILVWVRAVATALVAGVIARLLLFPTGVLADSPPPLRIAAVVIGFAAFKLARERVLVGIAAAEVVLIGGWYVLGGVSGT
ncbi:AzlD domain-containing protein [Breoghania sp. L-A4]|uniref:AzlD domain-containing protein n=1 Tax=Breoghania sp. L-A4 TaxID=2304600 RepID=UPI000E35B0E9|nr:AzlD domain-containing protein [Breoghania sp. L-A4]AXS40885.1 AzlD domain-containing protein [Breoghania sp. L-A4]